MSSLDGFITKHEQEGVAFASDSDQQFFRDVLKTFDCCVFGSKTFLAAKTEILRNLSGERLRLVQTRHPEKYADCQRPDMLEFSDLGAEEMIVDLTRRGKTRCAVLGGAGIYTQFLTQKLLDELWITVEPKIFGGGKKLMTEKCDITLTLKKFLALDADTLLLKYSL